MMENLLTFLPIASAALGLLVTTITFLAKFFKSEKAKRVAENINKVGNAVLPFIEQAETFLNYSGAEKKQFVLTQANQFALDNKLKFDPELISTKIEELVELTKKVNKRTKDPKPIFQQVNKNNFPVG